MFFITCFSKIAKDNLGWLDMGASRCFGFKETFEKAEEAIWECRNCGHLVMGKKAPQVCPVCQHPQSYFEIRKENY